MEDQNSSIATLSVGKSLGGERGVARMSNLNEKFDELIRDGVSGVDHIYGRFKQCMDEQKRNVRSRARTLADGDAAKNRLLEENSAEKIIRDAETRKKLDDIKRNYEQVERKLTDIANLLSGFDFEKKKEGKKEKETQIAEAIDTTDIKKVDTATAGDTPEEQPETPVIEVQTIASSDDTDFTDSTLQAEQPNSAKKTKKKLKKLKPAAIAFLSDSDSNATEADDEKPKKRKEETNNNPIRQKCKQIISEVTFTPPGTSLDMVDAEAEASKQIPRPQSTKQKTPLRREDVRTMKIRVKQKAADRNIHARLAHELMERDSFNGFLRLTDKEEREQIIKKAEGQSHRYRCNIANFQKHFPFRLTQSPAPKDQPNKTPEQKERRRIRNRWFANEQIKENTKEETKWVMRRVGKSAVPHCDILDELSPKDLAPFSSEYVKVDAEDYEPQEKRRRPQASLLGKLVYSRSVESHERLRMLISTSAKYGHRIEDVLKEKRLKKSKELQRLSLLKRRKSKEMSKRKMSNNGKSETVTEGLSGPSTDAKVEESVEKPESSTSVEAATKPAGTDLSKTNLSSKDLIKYITIDPDNKVYQNVFAYPVFVTHTPRKLPEEQGKRPSSREMIVRTSNTDVTSKNVRRTTGDTNMSCRKDLTRSKNSDNALKMKPWIPSSKISDNPSSTPRYTGNRSTPRLSSKPETKPPIGPKVFYDNFTHHQHLTAEDENFEENFQSVLNRIEKRMKGVFSIQNEKYEEITSVNRIPAEVDRIVEMVHDESYPTNDQTPSVPNDPAADVALQRKRLISKAVRFEDKPVIIEDRKPKKPKASSKRKTISSILKTFNEEPFEVDTTPTKDQKQNDVVDINDNRLEKFTNTLKEQKKNLSLKALKIIGEGHFGWNKPQRSHKKLTKNDLRKIMSNVEIVWFLPQLQNFGKTFDIPSPRPRPRMLPSNVVEKVEIKEEEVGNVVAPEEEVATIELPKGELRLEAEKFVEIKQVEPEREEVKDKDEEVIINEHPEFELDVKRNKRTLERPKKTSHCNIVKGKIEHRHGTALRLFYLIYFISVYICIASGNIAC